MGSLQLTLRTLVAPTVVGDEGPLPVGVDVASAEAGEKSFDVELPVLTFEALDVVEDIASTAPGSTADMAAVAAQQQALSQIGQALFDATLGQWGMWPVVRDHARTTGERLRIQVRTSSSVVASQPWEFLHDANTGGFLALDPIVSVVRNPERLGPTPALAATRPLRVLLCASAPADQSAIDVGGELQMLTSVLGGLGGAVEVFYLNQDPRVCTFAQFQDAIARHGPWHIVHFSGHGGFHPALGGMLLFTTPDSTSDSIPASQVGAVLGGHVPLRVVVLNSCRGAMGAGRQAIDSVAGSLVHRGVPACISMQFEVTDRAALPFARALHRGLVGHGDVDQAVAEARREINAVSLLPDDPLGSALRCAEWATPVLHLEAVDSLLFPPSANGSPAAVSSPTPIQAFVPQPARHRGNLEQVGRNRWRLTYRTELTGEQALDRTTTAVKSTMDVRRITEVAGGFDALVGGLFPGAFSATETVEVRVGDLGGERDVTVESYPKQFVLLDYGRNREALLRLAVHLGVDVV